VLLAASGALVVAAYAAGSRSDVEATTEVSAIVTLAAGTIAGLGFLTLASGITAVTVFILIEKSWLHSTVQRLDDRSLRAAARFAVMAAVVLPLLPAGPFGPWDTVRPREVWLLVLFFSGLSFAAYLARRFVGPRHGFTVAGLMGGLISSTSVTLTFSRASRSSAGYRRPLAYGVIAACTVLFIRVIVATSVLNPPVAWAVVPYLLPPFGVGLAALALGLRENRGEPDELDQPGNPLEIGAALQMAVLFQAVLIGVELARRTWGDAGVLASGAVLGLTDVDALTISMARGAADGIPTDVAARGIAAGILSNTVLKMSMALVVGGQRFRPLAGASLATMSLALALTLVLLS
jgi:uncharacterized membrane protein (DUF4010 family)